MLLASVLLCGLGACSSTLPTAESIDSLAAQVRQQAQPEFDSLERRRAGGQLTQDAYLAEKAALEKQVTDRVSEIAWTRHSLAESERKANGLPTPGSAVSVQANNPMQGGGASGSLYRPFTSQGMGAGNSGMLGGGGGLPSF